MYNMGSRKTHFVNNRAYSVVTRIVRHFEAIFMQFGKISIKNY